MEYYKTTAPMITEALRDEGIGAQVQDPYLRVALSASSELMISAQERGTGLCGFDLPVDVAGGFFADEFELGEDAEGAAYVYATGYAAPVGSLEQEVRWLARAVNRSVRGVTGKRYAVVLAAPVASLMTEGAVRRLVEGETGDRVAAMLEGPERTADGLGVVLFRRIPQDRAIDDLYHLKRALDIVWLAHTDRREVSDGELARYGASPGMLRAARGAVHDQWKR